MQVCLKILSGVLFLHAGTDFAELDPGGYSAIVFDNWHVLLASCGNTNTI